jgi:hypothetical protein
MRTAFPLNGRIATATRTSIRIHRRVRIVDTRGNLIIPQKWIFAYNFINQVLFSMVHLYSVIASLRETIPILILGLPRSPGLDVPFWLLDRRSLAMTLEGDCHA